MLYRLLAKYLLFVVAVLLVARIVPGITVDSTATAFLAALVLGIINVTLRPLLIVLTLPINFLTLGLFTFIINAGLLLLTASLLDGFAVESFLAALLSSVLMAFVQVVGARILNI